MGDKASRKRGILTLKYQDGTRHHHQLGGQREAVPSQLLQHAMCGLGGVQTMLIKASVNSKAKLKMTTQVMFKTFTFAAM